MIKDMDKAHSSGQTTMCSRASTKMEKETDSAQLSSLMAKNIGDFSKMINITEKAGVS
jgi:hypothetical protein